MAMAGTQEIPEWESIQQTTFTNWVNEQLKEVSMEVNDLIDDLIDGVRLINLVELLSKKSVGKYSKNPQGALSSGSATTKQRRGLLHFRQNIDKALKFLTKEGIRMENIGSEDIVTGNRRITLGLIWTLILHYQINFGKKRSSKDLDSRTPKQKLLDWVRSKIGPGTSYNCVVNNFTTDWNSGQLVCALCDACSPGLIKDWNLGSGEADCARGINTGQKRLTVPAVIEPEDMANPKCDELAMMTYVSGFRNAVLKDGDTGVPEPARSQGFAKGLYLEVSGPRSKLDIDNLGDENRGLSYVPEKSGDKFVINVYWKGKKVKGSPLVIDNK